MLSAVRARRITRLVTAASLAAIVTALLAACTPNVAMTAAPDANDPLCANVTVRLPSAIDDKQLDNTDAQATGAWGDPVAVQLSCGVPPLGPTTKPCVTVTTPDGSVDWVLTNNPAADVLTYITFGRTPAVEVTIDHSTGGVSDSDALNALTTAVSTIPRSTEKCVGAGDAP